MSEKLTLEILKKAIAGDAAAFRCVAELQPVGGSGDKVFPPTYEGGAYATETRALEGNRVPCVILDSVASQANRIELALLRAHRRKDIQIPVVEVDFAKELPDVGTISSLEAPHRIADAILRDSVTTDGTPFRDSDAGKSFTDASVKNATALFEWCPTALVLGMWDSTGPKGGLGAKFARCLVSEIVGIDVESGVRTSSRIDPLQIQKNAGVLFHATGGGWTLDEKRAAKEKGKPAKLGKDGKPSEANHGNIAPSLEAGKGGVTLARARQTTTLSLAGLRRLSFPVKGKDDEARNDAARTALAALGLCGAVLSQTAGLDLRSRCLLVPTDAPEWELLGAPGTEPQRLTLTKEEAFALLNKAVADAEAKGLSWRTIDYVLAPIPGLVTLVKESRRLAAASTNEEE